MNWAKIVENSSDLIQTDLKKEIKKEEQEIVYNPYSVLDFRNVEDEFLDNYIRKIENISFEFKQFVYNNYLPFMDKNINVKYNGRDFATLRKNLIDFAKEYYPNTYNDFNEASPGMMFLESAAYVGDVMSFYTDLSFTLSLQLQTF